MIELMSAVLSLTSGIAVALLAHLLARIHAKASNLAELRLKAYSDFIHAASRLAATRRLGNTKDEWLELAALNDAKARVCICGNVPVVKALTEFWQAGGTLEDEYEIISFTNLCSEMRSSLGHKRHDIAMFDIHSTLFKLEPSAYSYRANKSGGT